MNKIDYINKYKDILTEEMVNDLNNLDNAENYLKVAFNNNPCTICLINEKNEYEEINSTMMNLLNGTVIGSKVGSITHDENLSNLIDEVRKSSESIIHKIIETEINNQKKVFWISATKINEKILTTGLDITELRKLEQDQSFKDRLSLIGEMSSFIVHEINNPLFAISLYNNMIQTINNDSNIEIKQSTDNIEKMIKTISKIIESFKTISNNSNNIKEELFVNDIIEKAKIVLSGKLKQSKVSLSYNDTIQKIYGIDHQLLQVFINLISNSIDSIKNNENKWIKIEVNESYIDIIDSGNGINDEIALKMFDKFYTTKGKNGNGIGLYLCKEILKGFGYKLEYIKNKNTIFRITKGENV